MKGSVQWNLFYCWKDFHFQRVSNPGHSGRGTLIGKMSSKFYNSMHTTVLIRLQDRLFPLSRMTTNN